MTIRYFVSLPDGTRTGDLALSTAVSKVRKQARRYGPSKTRRMRLRERSEKDWGVWRKDLPPTIEAWKRRAETLENGEVLLLDFEDYPYTVATRAIEEKPPTIATDGNSDVDEIYSWLVRNVAGRNGGICNRRPIAGTSTWSQHSPWGGADPGSNAVDWFAAPDTMDALYDQGAKLARAGLPIGLILVGSKAWTPGGWGGSSAAYHRHLHIEGKTKRTGTPRSSC